MLGGVFICHSSYDEETANRIVTVLENAGVGCWIAPRDIAPAEEFTEAIFAALAAAPALVLLFSARANASQHVSREVARFVQDGGRIIPVRLEKVQPSETLEYFIHTAQWLDTTTRAEAEWQEALVRAARAVAAPSAPSAPLAPLAQPPGPKPEPPTPTPPGADRPQRPPVVRRVWRYFARLPRGRRIAVLAVVGLAAAYLLVALVAGAIVPAFTDWRDARAMRQDLEDAFPRVNDDCSFFDAGGDTELFASCPLSGAAGAGAQFWVFREQGDADGHRAELLSSNTGDNPDLVVKDWMVNRATWGTVVEETGSGGMASYYYDNNRFLVVVNPGDGTLKAAYNSLDLPSPSELPD